jgi:multidrug efflux pump
VIGGSIIGTALALVFVPIFFVVVRTFFKGSERQRQFDAEHGHQIGVDSHE